jgi:dynein heavy chain
LAYLSQNGISKDKEVKQVKKLFDEWNTLKKISKETKKEISPMVDNETKKNQTTITKFEETLKAFTNEIKKRGFYRYDTGKEGAVAELDQTREEVDEFKNNLNDLEFTAAKFEHPDATIASRGQIEIIETELKAMSQLWGHIGTCED